jgi:hypothetical protein
VTDLLHRLGTSAGPRRLPLTWALGALWSLSNACFAALPASATAAAERLASTSLPNLRAWPVALPLSGLLVEDKLWVWLPALALGVAAVEQAQGTRRTLLALAAVHVGATVLSQGLLWLRVTAAGAPRQLLDQLDVGPSYLVAAGLTLAVVLAPSRRRRTAALLALCLGAPDVVEGLRHLELEDTGHVAAVVLGLAIGVRLRTTAVPRAQAP